MHEITLELLKSRHDFSETDRRVRTALDGALADDEGRLRFFSRYASWNGFFGAGVATLSGKIARSRRLFVEAGFDVESAADRSVLVGSFFFDAARDEFDDRATIHRDTHRCLAQALILGVLEHGRSSDGASKFRDLAFVNELTREPDWLVKLNEQVAIGYGNGTPEDRRHLFLAMGYHLGSEVLADEEFTLMDSALREKDPELVAFLERTEIPIAGEQHGAYQWIRIHSGHGGGAEAEHFEWAVQGMRRALEYTPVAERDPAVSAALEGFEAFSRDHLLFFDRANAP